MTIKTLDVSTRLPPLSRPISRFVSQLPHPGAVVFANVLTLALRRELPADVYDQLIGRRIEIDVSDWRAKFRFVVTADRFAPLGSFAAIDLSITATARDFALLATGDEDADTLYFDRRLIVVGETELALLIKNTLDALPLPKMRKFVRLLHHGMVRVRTIQSRRGIFGRERAS